MAETFKVAVDGATYIFRCVRTNGPYRVFKCDVPHKCGDLFVCGDLDSIADRPWAAYTEKSSDDRTLWLNNKRGATRTFASMQSAGRAVIEAAQYGAANK